MSIELSKTPHGVDVATFTGFPGGVLKVALHEGLVYPLTPCCGASAKGMEDGTGCRSCFDLIDPLYGWGTTLDDYDHREAFAWVVLAQVLEVDRQRADDLTVEMFELFDGLNRKD